MLAQLVAEDARDGLGSGARPPAGYRAGVADGWTPVGERGGWGGGEGRGGGGIVWGSAWLTPSS